MSVPAPSDIEQACMVLAAGDSGLSRAFEVCGTPTWRSKPLTYATLAELVTYQLISTIAAASIWGRIEAHLGEVTPDTVLQAPVEALQACGQSRPKIAHMKSIAQAVETRALDLAGLPDMPRVQARQALLKVKGIGPWTAELVMLYGLGEIDAFPHGDVGLMESYRRLAGADVRLSGKAFSELAEGWRPYRGVAAHLLWAWLNAERAAEKQTGQTRKLS